MSSDSKVFDPRDYAVMPNEAAQYLGVTTGTMANWRADGKGPLYVRHEGGNVVYLRDDLEAYRNKNRIVPTPASTRRQSA